MDSALEIFLGLILGAILMYWVFNFFRLKKNKEITEHQSSVLLEKIKSVCKLISVEGEFAEVYKYENTKEHFMSMLTSKKKALVIINARAHIGYDLSKVSLFADNDRKKIILTSFPEPEVLSIEPDLQFYDVKNGLFNSFSPDDLTSLNLEAKQHIRDKIPESGLMDAATKEAKQAILLIEKIVETIGWTLEYSGIEITNREKQFIEQ